MAMSILFCTKNVLYHGKVWNWILGGTIFHGGDLSVVVRKGCYVSSLEMCHKPIGRVERKFWILWLSHMFWRFWEKLVGIYVDGVEICDIPIGEDDTRGSPVWVFYRNRLSGGKIARKVGPKIGKMTDFSRMWSRKIGFEIWLVPRAAFCKTNTEICTDLVRDPVFEGF